MLVASAGSIGITMKFVNQEPYLKAKTFPARLKALRIRADLSQAGLSKKAGINPHTYSKYELGAGNPSLAKLLLIANALNVTLDCLVAREVRTYHLQSTNEHLSENGIYDKKMESLK